MAEQLGRVPHVAGGEEVADPGRRDAALALGPHVVDDLDREAELLAERDEQVDVAGAARAVAEVAADEHGLRVEGVDEHALDELGGGHRCQGAIEREQHGRVDARAAEQLELLAHAHERVGALLGGEQRERVAVERDDHGAQVVGGRDRADAVDHGAMAAVHAVELADGHGARAEARGHRVEALVRLHAASAPFAAAFPPAASARLEPGAASGRDAAASEPGRCVASHHMPSTGSTSGMNR